MRRTLTQKLGAVVLGFEAIVVFLGGLTIYGLDVLPWGLADWWGIVGGTSVALVMLVTTRLLGSPAGMFLGWLLQIIVLLSAILVPAMLIVGLIFGGMWVYAVIVGGRVDRRDRAAARGAAESLDSSSDSLPGDPREQH